MPQIPNSVPLRLMQSGWIYTDVPGLRCRPKLWKTITYSTLVLCLWELNIRNGCCTCNIVISFMWVSIWNKPTDVSEVTVHRHLRNWELHLGQDLQCGVESRALICAGELNRTSAATNISCINFSLIWKRSTLMAAFFLSELTIPQLPSLVKSQRADAVLFVLHCITSETALSLLMYQELYL